MGRTLRLLVAEDSVRIREALVTGLRREGYAVDAVADGKLAWISARTTEYDAIILDIMLPEMDGLEVLQRSRQAGVQAPVLLLTARDAIDDRVRGLQAGADDYLVKPFAFEELVARIQALVRRQHAVRNSVVRVDDLEIDASRKQVFRAGAEVPLKPREYAILEYLAHHVDRPVSRIELEEHVYDQDSQVHSNAIDSAICSLRAKLEVTGARPLIHTRRGVGYVLSAREP
jgi:two-component system copper resistance phosphate regulon response regulator CusR